MINSNINTTFYEVINAINDYEDNIVSKEYLDKTLYSYLQNSNEYISSNSKQLYLSLIKVIFSKNEIKDFYYIMSSLFSITMIPEVFYEIIHTCISDQQLNKEMKFFIYNQCFSYIFLYPTINTIKARNLLDDLYYNIYKSYLNEISDTYSRIPLEERNPDLIFVITSQMLGINHGPTKIVYDRSYILETDLKKHVYIINTADTLSLADAISWFDYRVPNYHHNLGLDGKVTYKDRTFSFFQCPQNSMPNVEIMKQIVDIVVESKPWCIISIGGSNLTSDICSNIVPTLTVPLGLYDISYTTFQVIPNDIDTDTEHLLWLNKRCLNKNRFIKSLASFSLKPQTHNYKRSDLGIPEQAFVCLVVGYRLDAELSVDFIKMMISLIQHDIYFAFVGQFDHERIIPNSYQVRSHTVYLGLQEDTLAVCACCNVYINPLRSGGGTSAVEALYMGLPALTINYGDVANNVGEDFCVTSFDEMFDKTMKLFNDRTYYSEMSSKAKNRANLLTNSSDNFIKIIKEMTTNPAFE